MNNNLFSHVPDSTAKYASAIQTKELSLCILNMIIMLTEWGIAK